MGILWIRIPIEIRSIQTIPSPNQQSACPQDTLPHTKPKTQGATAQPRIPFIRKSPDLKHQENFSKGTPHDKISVQHPAQGLSEDGRRPLTVFLRHSGKKSPGQKAKNKKSRVTTICAMIVAMAAPATFNAGNGPIPKIKYYKQGVDTEKTSSAQRTKIF